MEWIHLLRKVTQPLYRHRKVWRLAEWVRRHYLAYDREVVVDDFDGDLRFECNLQSHIGSYIFWRGGYSQHHFPLLNRILSPEMVFVDVGANEGEHTLFAAKRLTRGRVIAFEPVTAIHQRLLRNLQINGLTRVVTEKVGLGNEATEVPIYGPDSRSDDGSLNDGNNTLFPVDGRFHRVETIRIVTLDDYVRQHGVDRVDVIKIDVEGAELAVLKGAVNTLRRFRPVILLEVFEKMSRAAGHSGRDLLDFLHPLGYRFEQVLGTGTTESIEAASLGSYQDVVCFASPRRAAA